MPRYYDGAIILEQRLDYEVSQNHRLNITVTVCTALTSPY